MCLQGYPSTASTSWSISNDTVAVSRWGRPWACTYLDLGVRPLHLEEGETPNVVRREHWSQRNNQRTRSRGSPRLCAVVWSLQEWTEGERATPKEKRWGSCLLTWESPCPSLTHFGGWTRSQWWGEGRGDREKERQNEGLYRCRGWLTCLLLEWLIERKGGRKSNSNSIVTRTARIRNRSLRKNGL